MSEDRTDDDAPGGSPTVAPPPDASALTVGPPSDAPPPDAPAPAPAAPPRSRRRLVVQSLLLVVTLVGAVLVHRARRPRGDDAGHEPAPGGHDSAAIRAPEGPAIPTAPDGVALTGFVVDGLGLPVVDAEISAELEADLSSPASAADTPGTPPATTSGVPMFWPKLATKPDAGTGAGVHVGAPTGADGRFVILGLAPGRYRLRVSGPGLLPAEVRYVQFPSDATRIVVSRQVAIEGLVTDGGKPVGNVTVGLRGDAIGGAIELKTDRRGAFAFAELPEGRYQAFAWTGSLAARALRVTRLGSGPFAPVELRLEAASIVVGRVIDRGEGTGVIAAIELRPSGDDQAPRYVRSGEDGTFRIEGVPNGRWIADAFAPGYLSPGGVELEAGRGIPELVLSRGGLIEGRVLDGDGEPVAGATVRALSVGKAPVEYSELVDQDRLRRFSGRIAAPSPVPGSRAADPQLIPRGELGVMVGPIPPIPAPGVQVARLAVIDPQIAALAGDPAPLPVDPAQSSIWKTGADGRYRIRGVAKGRIAALAVAPGFAEGHSKEITLDAGQVVTGADIMLAPGSYLVGKVSDQHGVPIVGALVSARPEVGMQLDAFSDEAGMYRLGPLSGPLELYASAYGHGDARAQLDVPVTKERAVEQREDIVLVVADATLAGILDDTNGAPVAGAHIEVVTGGGQGRSTVVAGDGTFLLRQLPAGPLRIRISHPDYPRQVVDATATTISGQSVRLRLPIGGAVEGAAIDASSGSPLTSITISGVGPGAATSEATTDKTGRWKLGPLKPGRWTLTLKLPGYLPLHRELDVPATRTPGGTSVRDIRLELARGALVGGTVRDRRGQRIAGATIRVRPFDGSGSTVEGTTDVAGEFRIRDAPTGDLLVSATKDELGGSTRVTIRPGSEVLGLSLEIE